MNQNTSNLVQAIQSAEKLFQFKVIEHELRIRTDGDTVINCFLTDSVGDQFFLKEIQAHSLRDGMDEIYRQLLTVNSSLFRFILPKTHTQGKFSFECVGKQFLLFGRETLVPFDPSQIDFQSLLGTMEEMHQKISRFDFSSQSYRSFASWIDRGLDKVIEKYGEGLPLVFRYKKFMLERYPSLQLGKGNIHWDIHKDNISMGADGRLQILDIDLMQKGVSSF